MSIRLYHINEHPTWEIEINYDLKLLHSNIRGYTPSSPYTINEEVHFFVKFRICFKTFSCTLSVDSRFPVPHN